jgi:hypothetical protein
MMILFWHYLSLLEWDCMLIMASTIGGLGLSAVVSFYTYLFEIAYIKKL